MFPFFSGFEAIEKHVEDYLKNWQQQMNDAVYSFSGNSVDAPTLSIGPISIFVTIYRTKPLRFRKEFGATTY